MGYICYCAQIIYHIMEFTEINFSGTESEQAQNTPFSDWYFIWHLLYNRGACHRK